MEFLPADGWYAQYKTTHTRVDGSEYVYWSTQPLCYWRDGVGYVTSDGDTPRKPTKADSYSNFTGYTRTPQGGSRLVQLIAAPAGLMAVYKFDDGDRRYPVDYIGLYDDGETKCLEMTGEGYLDTPEASSNFVEYDDPRWNR